MVKCGVFFEVRTEFLNIIMTSFGFQWLRLLLLLLLWGDTMPLWNWAPNGHIFHPSGDTRMNMEYHWNSLSKENLSQCHFVHHKSHWTYPRPYHFLGCEKSATNSLNYGKDPSYSFLLSNHTPWRHLGGERKYNSYSFTTSALNGDEWSASRPGRALAPGKGPPVPIVQEAGWVPQPVWTQRLEEKSFRL
jgi:hypothetical protein